jgi:hypothetical protein
LVPYYGNAIEVIDGGEGDVRLVEPCSAAQQGRFRRLACAILVSPPMASPRDGTFSTNS